MAVGASDSDSESGSAGGGAGGLEEQTVAATAEVGQQSVGQGADREGLEHREKVRFNYRTGA